MGRVVYAVSLAGSVRKFVPPFASLEVSGVGPAAAFRLDKTGDSAWGTGYGDRILTGQFLWVYPRLARGAYSCVFKALTPKWPAGGDPTIPGQSDQLFTYVVSAVNGSGVESQRGTTGTFNAATCP